MPILLYLLHHLPGGMLGHLGLWDLPARESRELCRESSEAPVVPTPSDMEKIRKKVEASERNITKAEALPSPSGCFPWDAPSFGVCIPRASGELLSLLGC